MPRKRVIAPAYWEKEDISRWNYQARLFYIALWNFADDKGRLRAHPGLLKSQVFPYDPLSKDDINKLKNVISNKVQWYSVDGSEYGWIRNFLEHQRIDRPSPSTIPEPPPELPNSTKARRTFEPNRSEVKLSKEKGSKDNPRISIEIQSVLDLLNSLSNKKHPNLTHNAKFIESRLKETSLEECLLVVRYMCKKWNKPFAKGQADWSQYLRPSTLFRPTNFHNYLVEAKSSKEPENDNKSKDDMDRLKVIQKEMRTKKKKKQEDTF